MKRIDAVIRQENLDNVRDRLTNVGVEGLTITEVLGHGRQKGHSGFYRLGRASFSQLVNRFFRTRAEFQH